MSSEYFELIPYHEFSWDKIEPLTNDDQLSNAVQKLTNLMDLELTNRILLGAHYRKKDVNPMDYVYRSLECQMQLLDENSTEAQLILQHIQNTSKCLFSLLPPFHIFFLMGYIDKIITGIGYFYVKVMTVINKYSEHG